MYVVPVFSIHTAGRVYKKFEFVHGRPCTCLQTSIHTAGRVYNTSLHFIASLKISGTIDNTGISDSLSHTSCLPFRIFVFYTRLSYTLSHNLSANVNIHTWHYPAPDVVQLRSQNPPAAMIRLLPWVAIQQHSCKAYLPQADVTEAGVDSRP